MHFIIIGRDEQDTKTFDRRLAVRQSHIDYSAPFFTAGNILYACALLENEKIVGSVMMFDFESRDKLDQYLENEPYVKANVWAHIEIKEIWIPDVLLSRCAG
jgi:uncharacterized protein YciI